MGVEAAMQNARGRIFLEYPYEKVLHGKEQQITVSFETDDGIQDTHLYSTKHGFRILARVDPPMPN